MMTMNRRDGPSLPLLAPLYRHAGGGGCRNSEHDEHTPREVFGHSLLLLGRGQRFGTSGRILAEHAGEGTAGTPARNWWRINSDTNSTFTSIDLALTRRFANNWMMQAVFSGTSKDNQNVAVVPQDNPTRTSTRRTRTSSGSRNCPAATGFRTTSRRRRCSSCAAANRGLARCSARDAADRYGVAGIPPTHCRRRTSHRSGRALRCRPIHVVDGNKPTPDSTLYVGYSRGFRSGGFNQRGFADFVALPLLLPSRAGPS
jgi:hypothetical protein